MDAYCGFQQNEAAASHQINRELWRIDDRTGALLRGVWAKFSKHIDPLVHEFYRFMSSIPGTAGFLADKGKVDCLKVLQKNHWASLFNGSFDQDFVTRARAVGMAHARIGLSPSYFIAGYALVMDEMIRTLVSGGRRRSGDLADEISATIRVLMMEMSFSLSVYSETKETEDRQRQMQELAELFEHELDQALEFVRRTGGGMEDATETMSHAARQVSKDVEHVTDVAQKANGNAQMIAGAAEKLSASITEISQQVEHSTQAAQAATGRSESARALAQELTVVSQRIGSIVQLIERISKETRLLALNANIEAARAGDAGRGFAVVAHEVKTLADQTNRATGDIRSEIQAMQAVIHNTVEAIGAVADRVAETTGDISVIAQAVSQQTTVTREIAENADLAASGAEDLHERIIRVSQEAEVSVRESDALRSNTKGLIEQVMGIRRRVIATLRSTRFADRRQDVRIAVDIPVQCVVGGKAYSSRLDNLSAHGAQVRDASLAKERGIERSVVELTVPDIGRATGKVVSIEPDILHIKFDQVEAGATERLLRALDSWKKDNEEVVAVARDAAQKIGKLFEEALARGEIKAEELWDVDYRMIKDSNPPQYLTRFTHFCDRVLPPIQEPLLVTYPRITFTAAVDSNGYLPTHNRKYSAPQRSDDSVWNTAHCRNRRIFDDRTGLAAARNRQPFLVQTYRRDMGGGEIAVMKDTSSPILINGQHWGGFRIGCRL
ncbi:methyl-accepting chemotaxis protein [Azospirillaceae bacterium]